MKAKEFDPAHLDVAAFAKADAQLAGEWAVSELTRFASSTVEPQSQSLVRWEARGESRAVRGDAPQVWVHVQASAQVQLECQRCLSAVAADVLATRSFLFVQGENSAAELDADSEDDVLAMTKSLNLQELIEDELLLALPVVPRHESCPQPLPTPDAAELPDDSNPHPFAALASLKRGGLPN